MGLKSLENKCIYIFFASVLCSLLLLDGYLMTFIKNSTGPLPLYFCKSFTGLSFCMVNIKFILLDSVTMFVFTPSSEILYTQPQLTGVLEAISPNIVSILHICMAAAAARLISQDSLSLRKLGVVLFTLRNFLDALDGTMARARKDTSSEFEKKVGYYMDGVCDAFGVLFLLMGCWAYLKNHPLKKPSLYSPLPSIKSPWLEKKERDVHTSSSKELTFFSRILFTVRKKACRSKHLPIYLGFQLFVCSTFWNRYISEFTRILEKPEVPENVQLLQGSFIRQPYTLLIFILWRWVNVHAQLELVLMSIFCDQLGEFLSLLHFFGWISVGITALLSEILLYDARSIFDV